MVKKKKAIKRTAALIHIGASEKAISAARLTLLDFLKSGADGNAIVAACNAFKDVCQVSNVTVRDCNLRG